MADTVLFHISDVHFGIEDRVALGRFADRVALEKPDGVICTGDLTQRAKKREYAAAREWFAGLGVPVLLEPGNHDMPYYSPVERFRTPFKRYEGLVRGVVSKLALDDIVFVPLLTTVSAQWRFPWSDGVIRERALAATISELEGLRDDRRLKVVTCHHPLAGDALGGPNPTIGGDAALAAVSSAGADVILSGHVHNAFDITHEVAGRRVRMIGSGTMSHRLRGSPPSYNVLTNSKQHGLTVENCQLG